MSLYYFTCGACAQRKIKCPNNFGMQSINSDCDSCQEYMAIIYEMASIYENEKKLDKEDEIKKIKMENEALRRAIIAMIEVDSDFVDIKNNFNNTIKDNLKTNLNIDLDIDLDIDL